MNSGPQITTRQRIEAALETPLSGCSDGDVVALAYFSGGSRTVSMM
jgi:hypothetical protein